MHGARPLSRYPFETIGLLAAGATGQQREAAPNENRLADGAVIP